MEGDCVKVYPGENGGKCPGNIYLKISVSSLGHF